jgi:hypothetical protein
MIKSRTIPRPENNEEVYMKRYYLFRSKYMSIFLHQFFSSDPDDIHDHPWDSFGIILTKGYNETIPLSTRLTIQKGVEVLEPTGRQTFRRRPGFFKFRRAKDMHRIQLLPGTEGKVWTLFIRFKRTRPWGFWKNGTWEEAENSGSRI